MERQFNLQVESHINSERGIGRKIFRVVKTLDTHIVDGYNRLHPCFSPDIAWKIGTKLTNNSALIGQDILGPFRPLSAYYSLYNGRLYVEWGQIDPNSNEAKLHERMRRDPIYINRKQKGAITRSGHMSQIYLPGCNGVVVTVALFDSLSHEDKRILDPRHVEYKMAKTLIANGVIPITSDGYPVKV